MCGGALKIKEEYTYSVGDNEGTSWDDDEWDLDDEEERLESWSRQQMLSMRHTQPTPTRPTKMRDLVTASNVTPWSRWRRRCPSHAQGKR